MRLLLDCGSGVFAKLRAAVDYHAVDAVVITPPARGPLPRPRPVLLRAHLRRRGAATRPPPPSLHAPPGALECWRRVVGAWGNDDLIEAAFDVREYDPAETLHVGPLTIRFQPVPHFVPTNAVELVAAAGGRFTFGADHGPSPELCEFARGTDLLLLEATLLAPERTGMRGPHHRRRRPASTRPAAGAAAARASPTSATSWTSRRPGADAERTFGGPVELARARAPSYTSERTAAAASRPVAEPPIKGRADPIPR